MENKSKGRSTRRNGRKSSTRKSRIHSNGKGISGKKGTSKRKSRQKVGKQPNQLSEKNEFSEDLPVKLIPEFKINNNHRVLRRKRGDSDKSMDEKAFTDCGRSRQMASYDFNTRNALQRTSLIPPSRIEFDNSSDINSRKVQPLEEMKKKASHKQQKKTLKIRIENSFKSSQKKKKVNNELSPAPAPGMNSLDPRNLFNPSGQFNFNTQSNMGPSELMNFDQEIKGSDIGSVHGLTSKVKSSICNSPMPPKTSQFVKAKSSCDRAEKLDVQEENNSQAFFGDYKKKVWQNAIRCNEITDGKMEGMLTPEPQSGYNPFRDNSMNNSGSYQEGQTPGFQSKNSNNVFLFGDNRSQSPQIVVERFNS